MSEDINKKLKQITDILGQENMPDNFKGLLNMFASQLSSDEPTQKSENPKVIEQTAPAAKEEKQQRSEFEDNMEMVRRVKNIMEHMNNNNDPRVNLLNAIRPFLNNSRQKKVSNCIRLLQMVSISRLIDDSDKGSSM